MDYINLLLMQKFSFSEPYFSDLSVVYKPMNVLVVYDII